MRPLAARYRDRIAPPDRRRTRRTKGDGPALAAISAVAAWRRFRAKKKDGRRRRRVPPWRRYAWRLGLVSAAGAATGAMGFWLWHAGHVATATDRAEAELVGAMAAVGLTIRQVTLEGRISTPRAALVAAAGLRIGEPILLVDIAAARRRIERLGWVKTASVGRRLPGRIHIRIRERVPFARWQRLGETVLIDAEGATIIGQDLGRYRRLPRVVGDGAATAAAAFLATLRQEDRLFRLVRTATLVRQRRWDVGLQGGITIRLPETDAAGAWRRLARLDEKDRILKRDLVAIDLRLPDRLIVRLPPSAARYRRDPGKET